MRDYYVQSQAMHTEAKEDELYFIPTHARVPLENGTKALSILRASLGSSQRVGSNFRELGK
jgi:hypothetical protein